MNILLPKHFKNLTYIIFMIWFLIIDNGSSLSHTTHLNWLINSQLIKG